MNGRRVSMNGPTQAAPPRAITLPKKSMTTMAGMNHPYRRNHKGVWNTLTFCRILHLNICATSGPYKF